MVGAAGLGGGLFYALVQHCCTVDHSDPAYFGFRIFFQGGFDRFWVDGWVCWGVVYGGLAKKKVG